jgi:hypothetical protein
LRANFIDIEKFSRRQHMRFIDRAATIRVNSTALFRGISFRTLLSSARDEAIF